MYRCSIWIFKTPSPIDLFLFLFFSSFDTGILQHLIQISIFIFEPWLIPDEATNPRMLNWQTLNQQFKENVLGEYFLFKVSLHKCLNSCDTRMHQYNFFSSWIYPPLCILKTTSSETIGSTHENPGISRESSNRLALQFRHQMGGSKVILHAL